MNWRYGLLMFALIGLVFAQTDVQSKLQGILGTIKTILCNIFPIAIVIAIVAAAIIYTLGQMTPADMRARMTQWANALIMGAVAAGLIYLILPWLLNQLTSQNFSC